MKIWKHVWLVAMVAMLAIVTAAGLAVAGPNTRTLEVEIYTTETIYKPVYHVLVDPLDPVNEAACTTIETGGYGCVEYEEMCVGEESSFKLEPIDEHGNSHVFGPAPDGTLNVTGEYRDCSVGNEFWCEIGLKPWGPWTEEDLNQAGNSDNWKFASHHDQYRNVIAYYETCGETEEVCVEWVDTREFSFDCPPDSVATTTEWVPFQYDVVVAELYAGEPINVRGHIFTNKPKPVVYWYLLERVWPNGTPQLIAKSPKINVPDVNGVYATDTYSFSTEGLKPGIYRVRLRIKKIDGTIGGIRTKVLVKAPSEESPQ